MVFQNGGNRFGDYAQMTLDPDGETLWYTGEYLSTNGTRRTKIFSFNMDDLANTAETLADEMNLNISQKRRFYQRFNGGFERSKNGDQYLFGQW